MVLTSYRLPFHESPMDEVSSIVDDCTEASAVLRKITLLAFLPMSLVL